ncbi:MAG TPA: hypothetical protein VFY79_12595, partial [Dehalococcoidia bacterium]|nr:hypothetical protein [Dehalococcoidia bacterium]
EDVSDVVWWAFLVGVYVPVTMLLAWPLTHMLGLWPKQPERRPAPEPRAEHVPVASPFAIQGPSAAPLANSE